MKKRIMKFIVLLVALFAGTEVKAQSEALYIYRNDSTFNAFFVEDIDSITTSYSDASGRVYDYAKSQVVWTKDSVYYIPLLSIDSISYTTPETVYQPQVRKLDELIPYITGVNDMRLSLSSATPTNLHPRVGDVLVYEKFDQEMLPHGFAGKVTEILGDDVVCDSVVLSDIYQQLFCFGEYIAATDSSDSEVAPAIKLYPKRFPPINGQVSKSLSLAGVVGNDNINLKLEGELGATIHVCLKFGFGQPAYFDASIENYFNLKASWNVSAKGETNLLKKYTNPFKIPIPDTPLYVEGCGGPFLEFSIEASAKLEETVSLGYKAGLMYDKKWTPYFKNTSKGFGEPTFEGHIEGSAFLGGGMEFSIATIGDILKAGISERVGPKVTADLSAELLESNNYDRFKGSTLKLDLGYKTDISASLKFTSFLKAEASYTVVDGKLDINEWNFFPQFEKPELISQGVLSAKTAVEATEDGKTIFGYTAGLGLLDKNGTLLQTKYADQKLRTHDDWPDGKFETSFSGLAPLQQYTIAPIFKLFDNDVIATPRLDFTANSVPVKIKSVNVTKANYYPEHYTYNNQKYDFKYYCTTNLELDDENIDSLAGWGYLYKDQNGNYVPIAVPLDAGKTYADNRYAYCRNESSTNLTLIPYVILKSDQEHYMVGSERNLNIEYPSTTGLVMTKCSFQGNESDVNYDGKNYKHKSTYRMEFTTTGAYWLTVQTNETGSGWTGWDLFPQPYKPVDGANAMTVNYYYDDVTFSGDYKVGLKGTDSTHGKTVASSEHATYTYSGGTFSGCEQSLSTKAQRLIKSSYIKPDGEAVYDIIINQIHN